MANLSQTLLNLISPNNAFVKCMSCGAVTTLKCRSAIAAKKVCLLLIHQREPYPRQPPHVLRRDCRCEVTQYRAQRDPFAGMSVLERGCIVNIAAATPNVASCNVLVTASSRSSSMFSMSLALLEALTISLILCSLNYDKRHLPPYSQHSSIGTASPKRRWPCSRGTLCLPCGYSSTCACRPSLAFVLRTSVDKD